MRFWPPYFGAGIRVTHVEPDLSAVEVAMKLRFWNRNYVNTHFGGSLYAMVDPFFMLMLIENLGRDYIVWDKAAHIDFRRPGKGLVTARFDLPPDTVESIRNAADSQPKVEPRFHVDILDQEGTVVARVEKTLYVRRRAPSSTKGNSESSERRRGSR